MKKTVPFLLCVSTLFALVTANAQTLKVTNQLSNSGDTGSKNLLVYVYKCTDTYYRCIDKELVTKTKVINNSTQSVNVPYWGIVNQYYTVFLDAQGNEICRSQEFWSNSYSKTATMVISGNASSPDCQSNYLKK